MKKIITHPNQIELKKVKKRDLENAMSRWTYGQKYTTVKRFGEAFKKSWKNKK